MPNWCFNTLSINTRTEGGKVLANAFRPKYRDENGRQYASPFHDLMPIPDDLQIESGFFGKDTPKQKEMEEKYKANIEKYGYKSWYEWCIANWGTKWDARVEDYIDHTDHEIEVLFDTAWSPAVEFFYWFSEQYPDAEFYCEYTEECMGYEGNFGKEDGIFFDHCEDTEPQEEIDG